MARRAGTPTTSLAMLMGLLVAAVFGVKLANGDDEPSQSTDPSNGTVVHVVDGDTLVVRLGGSEERVRLIGIDTPESVAPDQPVECYGPEASHRLEELLPPGAAVRLERDIEPRDRYGRLLAYIYRLDDNLFVNKDQVANGFAEAKDYPPNTTLSAELHEAQATAQAAGAGLWSACGGT